jgi:beta-propeller repeat-containing protein
MGVLEIAGPRRPVRVAAALAVLTMVPMAATEADAAPAPLVAHAQPATATATVTAPGVDGAYGRLQLAFMRDGDSYVARTASGSIVLRRGEAAITPTHGRRLGEPLTLGLADALDVDPQVQQRLPGVVNDLRGDDRSGWRTDIPTFGRIRYAGVYPGIDLDYHGTSGTLEYDFRLAPGADPGRISVDFHGASLRLTRSGTLVAGRGPDRLRQAPPVAFQPAASGRDPVPARFVLHGDRVGFQLGAYDPSRPLVIDPLLLSYATLLGGSDADRVNDIAVDSTGAAYLAGYTISDSFPTSSGAYDTTRAGVDVIVTKLNPTGSALVYSTLLGGSGTDFADTVAVDATGHAFVAGQTVPDTSPGATPFPTAGGAYTNTSNDPGYGNAFVTELNPSGNALVYSSVFGGSDQEEVRAIALDSAGAAYVGGYTASTGNAATAFPASAGAYQTTFGGTSRDGFVTKLNSTGARVYSTYLGGSSQDEVSGLDVDSQGRAYVTGFAYGSSSNTFPTTPANRFAPVEENNTDAFLSRLSPDGASLGYSTGIGTDGNGSANNGDDYGYAVAVGPTDGIAYITGATRTGSGPNGDFPLKHQYEGRSGGSYGLDVFVAKFDTTASGGASLLYSTLIGGDGTEAAQAIDVDPAGSAYVTGVTGNASGNYYDTTAGELGGGTNRGSVFVTEVDQSGSASATLGFSTTIPGTTGADSVGGIVYDETAEATYVGGTTWGGNPTTTGAYQTTPQGDRDGFAAKITVGSDSTPPDTAISTGPADGAAVTTSSVTFGFSSTEGGSTFECAYDGGAFVACTSPGPGTTGSDTRTLANGAHTFAVRARDGATNVDPTPATRSFTVSVASTPPPPPPAPPAPPAADTTPPDTTVTKAPPKSFTVKKRASVTVEFTSTELGSTFTCKVDDGPAQSCRSGATFRLGKGKHTISIAATDAAGNSDRSPATVTVKVKIKKKKPPQ